MNKFKTIKSTCLLIDIENIDTDQIIPARFLKITKRNGFGKYLFYNWRFDNKGKPKKNPYFDESKRSGHKILIAGNNFGCGSSREHAVWALTDAGFKAVISSAFGDIFYNNSLKNWLIPVILKSTELKQLIQTIKKYPETKIKIDLIKQSVMLNLSRLKSGQVRNDNVLEYNFPIDPFRKSCLIKGVDELGYILTFNKQISTYEKFRVDSL